MTRRFISFLFFTSLLGQVLLCTVFCCLSCVIHCFVLISYLLILSLEPLVGEPELKKMATNTSVQALRQIFKFMSKGPGFDTLMNKVLVIFYFFLKPFTNLVLNFDILRPVYHVYCSFSRL